MEQGHSRAQRWRELTAQARRTGGAMAFAGGMIWRHARFLAIIIVALSLVGGVAQPLLVWAMTGLINVLAALPANPWGEVLPWLGVLFAAYVVPDIRNTLTLYCGGLVRERLKVALQRRLLEHMAAVPLTYYEQPEYYHKLENGWTALSRRVSSELERVAGQLSALLGTAGLLALYAQAHWLLPVVLAATSIASVVIGGTAGTAVCRGELRALTAAPRGALLGAAAGRPGRGAGAAAVRAGRRVTRPLAGRLQPASRRPDRCPLETGLGELGEHCPPGVDPLGDGGGAPGAGEPGPDHAREPSGAAVRARDRSATSSNCCPITPLPWWITTRAGSICGTSSPLLRSRGRPVPIRRRRDRCGKGCSFTG